MNFLTKAQASGRTLSSANGDIVCVSQPPAKKFKGDTMLRGYLADSDDDSNWNDNTGAPTEMLGMKIERYAAAKHDASVPPIVFWRSAQTQYPLLSAVAFKYLSIPANSIPSERLFSTAGIVASKLRFFTSLEIVSKI